MNGIIVVTGHAFASFAEFPRLNLPYFSIFRLFALGPPSRLDRPPQQKILLRMSHQVETPVMSMVMSRMAKNPHDLLMKGIQVKFIP